jgi:peptidoglycan/xylan/chitin deacetylase (PgdA/CDA1 family)
VTDSPIGHTLRFWKPALAAEALDALAAYRDPGTPPLPGINVWRSDTAARLYRLADGAATARLFAPVHPIVSVPAGAEPLAEILDPAGLHYSYVLLYPDLGAVVVPFDPNEAIESFWYEDWVPVGERTALPKPLLTLYYAVKPLMPRALKRRMRRSMARKALASPSSLAWPTDDSLDSLQRFLLRLIMLASGRSELEFAWFWPDGHPWAVTLTHDVETAAGLARVPHVADLESVRGLRSSFNVVFHDYDVPDDLVRSLGERGFEVGVHGYTHDGLLFSRRALFAERAAAINEYAHRIGAAGFRSPATYRNREWMQDLDFEYDSSFSNSAPCEPQPGGCASFFPYPLGKLTELPMTLPMDHTLFELLEQADSGTWLAALETIRVANGMACVLAHPDPAPGYIGIAANEQSYLRVLDAVAASDAWVPLPRDLARWWRARAEAPVGDSGALVGSSSAIARLGADGRLEIVPPQRGSA